METWKDWQLLRVVRSQNENIKCDVWAPLKDGSFLFGVLGKTREAYDVVIDESVDLWPPTCSCPDNTYRPFLCKHICFCLHKLGCDNLSVLLWEAPDQDMLSEWLSNAPDVVE